MRLHRREESTIGESIKERRVYRRGESAGEETL
jgi:hypothetical protein